MQLSAVILLSASKILLKILTSRIVGMAKDAFNKRKELLTRNIRVDLRKRLVKITLVWPVVLYGCETWIMRKEEINRLNAFEMWVWTRMGKVSWMDKRQMN